MNVYPTRSVLYMNDQEFVDYGGETGTSTTKQRNAAYLIAEKAASRSIGTVLLPMDITGTFHPDFHGQVVLDYGYVHQIHWMRLVYANCVGRFPGDPLVYYVSGSNYQNLLDARRGYLSVTNSLAYYGWNPTEIEIAYRAGIPTGSLQEDHMQALCILSDIALKDIYDPSGNESVGDIGVQKWSSEGYSEERVALGKTDLGSSPRSKRAYNLLADLRIVRMGNAG